MIFLCIIIKYQLLAIEPSGFITEPQTPFFFLLLLLFVLPLLLLLLALLTTKSLAAGPIKPMELKIERFFFFLIPVGSQLVYPLAGLKFLTYCGVFQIFLKVLLTTPSRSGSGSF